MDLLLRRVTTSVLARCSLSLLYGFSPYVIASLAVSHLMLAWIGVLPLIALGVTDSLAEERGRALRGQVLLAAALVVQFFLSTELLLLGAIVVVIVLLVLGVTALVERQLPPRSDVVLRRLAPPLGVAVVLLALPAGYALWGPRSLKGNVWGAGFNPYTGGTSFLDLVRPHVVAAQLTTYSGYTGGALVQLQLLGWALLAVALVLGAWRWRDAVSRAATITTFVCVILSLSPFYVSWAPWKWIGKLPVLQNVAQFRITIFAMLAALLVVARGVAHLERWGRWGLAASGAVLALVIVPIAIPVAQSLPLRTVHVAVPTWWRTAKGPGVVLAYPYPGPLLQGPLTWQAESGFAVSMLGGSGPQGTVARAGPDAAATAVLDDLSTEVAGRPTATAANARLVRSMVLRDGVTEVVVPVTLHGHFLATGQPPAPAAVFFTEVLGVAPTIERDAWVFAVTGSLPSPHLVATAHAATCARLGAASPVALAPCVLTGAGR
jgi:hypothetical protein